MSEGSHSSARLATWTLFVVSVPVLYLLSVPPITFKAMIEAGTRGEPDWVSAYRKPYDWVRDHTPPLENLFDRYETLCWHWLEPK